jgi:Domain of unknown function (DUF4070)
LQASLETRLYKRMQKESRPFNEFSGDNVDGSTNIIPSWDWSLCVKSAEKSSNKIYAPKFYYERVLHGN